MLAFGCPARARTWKTRSKFSCVTSYTTGQKTASRRSSLASRKIQPTKNKQPRDARCQMRDTCPDHRAKNRISSFVSRISKNSTNEKQTTPRCKMPDARYFSWPPAKKLRRAVDDLFFVGLNDPGLQGVPKLLGDRMSDVTVFRLGIVHGNLFLGRDREVCAAFI